LTYGLVPCDSLKNLTMPDDGQERLKLVAILMLF
jgi:hypothetical protein